MAESNLTTAERPRRIGLRAARLYDGVSQALTPNPIVIMDGATIVAADHAEPPTDADMVDLGDATLLPGLVDTHVHLAFDASADVVAALAARDDAQALAAMAEAARSALRGGVTTVRDLGDRNYLSLQLRGRDRLPTVLAAGPPITTLGGHCHYLGGAVRPGVECTRAAVREHHDRGVDVIKVMASGGTLTPGTRQELAQFAPEELTAIVDEAHRLGLAVTAHAHGRPAIEDALAAGVDAMEHVSFWTEDGIDAPQHLIELIAQRQVVVGMTLGVREIDGVLPPPAVLARLPKIMDTLQQLRAAGARLVVGSDAGLGPPKPADVVRYAYAQLLQLGYAPIEALRVLTSGGATACGLAERKGRLAAGYDADILAVDGDPTADPSAIHRIAAVYARGQAISLT